MLAATVQPGRAADEALIELGIALRQTGYRHVTVTPATHRRVNARPANWLATDLVGVLGWSRPFREDAIEPQWFQRMHEAGILERNGALWRSTLRASTLDEQVLFHSPFPTDDDDAVFFGPDTYRFLRALLPELGARAVRRAVDIGCGAGPAAIAIALRHPNADVLAVDINPRALHLTKVNAALAGAANVTTLHSELLSGTGGDFDLIAANPPFVLDGDQRTYRHGGGALGLQVSLDIVDAALDRLAAGGRLLMYTGVAIVKGVDPLLESIKWKLDEAGAAWTYEEVDPDIFGGELNKPAYKDVDRIAAVWLTVQRPQDEQ